MSGNFYCTNNGLTSLDGCPMEVGGGSSRLSRALTKLRDCSRL